MADTLAAMPIFLRSLSALAMAVVFLLGGAPLASAHADLESSSPADNASLSSPPQQVVLRFDAPVDPAFSTVRVIGPDGTSHWEKGEPVTSGKQVTTGLRSLDDAGWYAVTYRVLTTDGHPVSGTVQFELRKPSGATTAPQPAPGASQQHDTDGFGWWPWLVVGAVVLIAGGGLAARLVTRGQKID